eukprot:Mycagemm_TRINITY_DN10070_c0_g1::TRINITY_DN10070_c0_g1_i1::g.2154::m.2154 type:complete len:127 gc:universal TRINITY_DN10070_c0_g1_i1:433-53(-)
MPVHAVLSGARFTLTVNGSTLSTTPSSSLSQLPRSSTIHVASSSLTFALVSQLHGSHFLLPLRHPFVPRLTVHRPQERQRPYIVLCCYSNPHARLSLLLCGFATCESGGCRPAACRLRCFVGLVKT